MEKPILAAMLSCAGEKLTDDEKYLFSAYNPLGITLFSRNIISKEQTKKLVDEIKNTINREDVLIAIDEEGGRVSRLKNITSTQYVSAEILGNSPLEYSQLQAELVSLDMRELGINVNYAPVIDKQTIPQNPVLKGRCFNTRDDKIIECATTMAQSFISMGICPCIKHLPTHFSSLEDPHLYPLSTDMPINEIEKTISYLQALADYPMAMTAHVRITAIDAEFPVTMSKKIIDRLLRGYLNFDGFLLSDAIDMHALEGDMLQRAKLSMSAGVDAVCYCSGRYKDLYAICNEKRFMTEKSLIRFAKIKNVIHNTKKSVNKNELQKRYTCQFSNKQEQHYGYDATETLNQMLKKGENL